MGKCTAITRGGDRCRGVTIEGSDYCYAHHPDHEQDRRRAARKGGKRGGAAPLASWQGSVPASRSWLIRSLTGRWTAPPAPSPGSSSTVPGRASGTA